MFNKQPHNLDPFLAMTPATALDTELKGLGG